MSETMPDAVPDPVPERGLAGDRVVAPPAAGASRPILPVSVWRLTYEAGGRRLVDGVTMTLAAGTRTVVMGPNGAGKTLLLRLLHGLLTPSAGKVSWAGAAMGPEIRRRQAMVFQRPVMLRRSAAANIRFALGLRGHRRRERQDRALAALRSAGLAACADRPARVLSGGEQQRLAIARALALEPHVLFLDEPTASLDPPSVVAIEAMVMEAHARGTKIIFVTHDLGQARRLADDVVFLHHGRVVEHAPAPRFFNRPAADAARAFLEGRIAV